MNCRRRRRTALPQSQEQRDEVTYKIITCTSVWLSFNRMQSEQRADQRSVEYLDLSNS